MIIGIPRIYITADVLCPGNYTNGAEKGVVCIGKMNLKSQVEFIKGNFKTF